MQKLECRRKPRTVFYGTSWLLIPTALPFRIVYRQQQMIGVSFFTLTGRAKWNIESGWFSRTSP